jgi:hypothetical protein
LVSLKLQARFFLLPTSLRELSSHGLPFKDEHTLYRGNAGQHLDRIIFAIGDRNLANDLPEFLDSIRALPEENHLEVVATAAHYANALQEVGRDEEMVYVRLVSAVEVLARDQPTPADALEGKRAVDVLKPEVLPPQVQEEFEKLLQTRRTKMRFVAFLQEYSREFFAGELTEPKHTQVTPGTLAEVARTVYDARSGYLHNGDPMHLPLRMGNIHHGHLDPSFGGIEQDRRFTEKQKLPYTDFFHRLVRHCIMARIARLTASRTAGEGTAA